MTSTSLKAKIYAGFAFMVVLLLLTGIASYLGLSKLSEGRAEIRSVEAANATALLIDRDVQELRMRVDLYVSSGGEAQFAAVRSVQARVARRLERAATEISDPEMLSLFEKIAIHVNQYAVNLAEVETERGLRGTLVNEALPSKANEVERHFKLLSSAIESGARDDTTKLKVATAQAAFFRAQRSLSSYFSDPDTGVVNVAVSQLNDARTIVESLPRAFQRRSVLLTDFDEFERIGLRAVQATRSYLFFLNVVMAGEASEVAHYSAVLRDVASQRRSTIAAQSLSTTENTTGLTVAMVAAAVVLSLIIAGRLVVLIVPPITRLTTTFEKLATGATAVDIPAPVVERGDEIGRMAKAAKFFGEQNQKTRRLLGESEQLRIKLVDETRKLEASNKELDDFAYVASHDLKSPLRGISQLAKWIGEDSEQTMSEESREHLTLLTSRIEKMDSLLEDLLNYSRAGRVEPEAEPIDLGDLMDTVIELTDNPHGMKISVPANLPSLHVVAPPLEQVLRNLIGNAVNHNHRGKDGAVDVRFRLLDGWFEFQVRDNGPGIEPKNHGRAFKMYQRLNVNAVAGSGMGLAIIKKQVETRGGKLSLVSELEQGATFTFTWPLTQVVTDHEHRKAS